MNNQTGGSRTWATRAISVEVGQLKFSLYWQGSKVLCRRWEGRFHEQFEIPSSVAREARLPWCLASVKALIIGNPDKFRALPVVFSDAASTGHWEPVARPPNTENAAPARLTNSRGPVVNRSAKRARERASTQQSMPSFAGTICSMGMVKRNNSERGEYQVYEISLQNSNRIMPFIGTHLSELAQEQQLREGDRIRISHLGRRPFIHVDSNGKTEERHRNEYSIVRI